MRKVILASASPRRKELLQNIGLKFAVAVSDADESSVPKELEPGLYVRELSFIKALTVAKVSGKDSFVIGADTVVVHGGDILGKPLGKDDARGMLRRLSGDTHYVYTGISVVDTNTMETVSEFEKTAVTFRELTDREIDYYVDNYSVLDKAGSYAIQEYAGTFVKCIQGDYFNIVGLPVCRLCELVKKEFGEDLV